MGNLVYVLKRPDGTLDERYLSSGTNARSWAWSKLAGDEHFNVLCDSWATWRRRKRTEGWRCVKARLVDGRLVEVEE